jgi:hypothetical protein
MPEKQEPVMTHEDVRKLLAAVIAEHRAFDPPEPNPIPVDQLTFSMFSELLYGLRVHDLSGSAPRQLLPVTVEVVRGQGKLKLNSRPHGGKSIQVLYAGKDPVLHSIPGTDHHPPLWIDVSHPALVVAVRVLDANDAPILVSFVDNTVKPTGVGHAAEEPVPAHSSAYAEPSQAS